jgi:hypothetical protein
LLIGNRQKLKKFILKFQMKIFLLNRRAIPDTPKDIQDHIKREQHLICQTLLQGEIAGSDYNIKPDDEDNSPEDNGKTDDFQANVSIV